MLMRLLVLAALVLVCSATSCVTTTGIAVLPAPGEGDADSVRGAVYQVAAAVAARHGLTPKDTDKVTGLPTCSANSQLVLCAATRQDTVQLRLDERAAKFTPAADSLRLDLLDSLRTRFGNARVRECKWHYDRDRRKVGCENP